MRRIAAAFVTLIIGLSTVIPLTSVSAATVNLVPNPSVEQSANGVPTSWSNIKIGNNATNFNYLNTGRTGTHSLQVKMTQRSSGNAKWYFTPVAVNPNTYYTLTDWYQASVPNRLQAVVTRTNGATSIYTSIAQPKSTIWKQASIRFRTPADAKTLTVYHYINQVGQLTTDDFNMQGTVPAPPTVNITSPTNGATVSGTQTVAASASDAQGIANVQFKLDGNNLGAADTTAPYSVAWDTKTAVNGNHVLTAVATNKVNLSTTSSPVTVNVQNAAPPTVSFSSPAAGATVSGTSQPVTVTASTDTIGVQFKLDGINLGAEDTTAPYSVDWNTTATSDGNHTLSAIARNAASLTATATEVVIVQNGQTPPPPPPPPTNLIPNPSLEVSTNGTSPDSWIGEKWGTNTATFSYLNSGHTGARSVKAQITSYSNGAANWYYNSVPVIAGKTYKYENWYQSNVDTEVDVEVVMSNGSVQYYWLGTALASTSWNKFSATFTVPAGAKSMTAYHLLARVGYLVTDDYSLAEYVPQTLNRGIVSLTFDDAWRSQYYNGLPLLQKYNLPATFYLLSGVVGELDYMDTTMMQALANQGNEIAAHTVTHPHLPQLTVSQMDAELGNC